MAALKRLVALGALSLAACGELKGLDGPAPPVVSFDAWFSNDLTPLRPPGVTEERQLRAALVWGAPWLPEPFCVLPPESEQAAAVIAAGCRDPFGFVPAAVTASVRVKQYGGASVGLDGPPAADVMVGDASGRVAYGSLVVFDDRDGSGALELARAHGTAGGASTAQEIDVPDAPDLIYGASFVTMTENDFRVAYREGRFDASSTFYPRAGCAPPEPGFSLVGARGFSREEGLAAVLAGTLPAQDPASCFGVSPDGTSIGVIARSPAEVQEVACAQATSGAARYREPPTDAPDLTDRVAACVHVPALETAGAPSGLMQMVVSGRSTDRCKGLTHYVLRGCSGNPTCAQPEWDLTAAPPPWWPCP